MFAQWRSVLLVMAAMALMARADSSSDSSSLVIDSLHATSDSVDGSFEEEEWDFEVQGSASFSMDDPFDDPFSDPVTRLRRHLQDASGSNDGSFPDDWDFPDPEFQGSFSSDDSFESEPVNRLRRHLQDTSDSNDDDWDFPDPELLGSFSFSTDGSLFDGSSENAASEPVDRRRNLRG